MKKIFTTLLIVLVAFGISNAQIKFGPKIGINLANVSTSPEDEELETKMTTLFSVGLLADIGFTENVGLQSGLMYSAKGFKVDEQDDEFDFGLKMNASFNYLELPIHFVYKLKSLQIYAGPYVAYGLGGKAKTEWTFGDETETDELKFVSKLGEVSWEDYMEQADDESFLNALDYGLNFGLGYELNGILINAGYSMGFGNVLPKIENDEDEDTMKNSVISISAAYLLSGKK